mmetsp:Transcript_16297/g.33757  ORF Transcript_16297/g.33757 Transcript_16297/m.33757 type:complete len:490 (-) Transcript_16297:248-1717(-)
MKWIASNFAVVLLWVSTTANVVASDAPSANPTASSYPSAVPSSSPSSSLNPTTVPSSAPSSSFGPSTSPSDVPSVSPSDSPSDAPSATPSLSLVPSFEGQSQPPSSSPSISPSMSPSVSFAPSQGPREQFGTQVASPKGTLPADVMAAYSDQVFSYIDGNSTQTTRRALALVRTVGSVTVTVDAELINCDLIVNLGINATGLDCCDVLTTITAPVSAGVDLDVIVSTVETDVKSGDFSAAIATRSGLALTVVLEASEQPSSAPSSNPSNSVVPSEVPSASPSGSPSDVPSVTPSSTPSDTPSVTPSLAPTDLVCKDDPNFFLNGVTRLTCAWVEKKKTETRCLLVDKISGELVSFYCQETCIDSCSSEAPTEVPTPAPTFLPSAKDPCLDRSGYLYNGKEGKGCNWAARRVTKRCKKKEGRDIGGKVKDYCPSVCDLRCKCTNSKENFRFKGQKVTCKILRKNQCQKKKGKKIIADFCPRKCKDCYKEQ